MCFLVLIAALGFYVSTVENVIAVGLFAAVHWVRAVLSLVGTLSMIVKLWDLDQSWSPILFALLLVSIIYFAIAMSCSTYYQELKRRNAQDLTLERLSPAM